jgi:hypothetical protein
MLDMTSLVRWWFISFRFRPDLDDLSHSNSLTSANEEGKALPLEWLLGVNQWSDEPPQARMLIRIF